MWKPALGMLAGALLLLAMPLVPPVYAVVAIVLPSLAVFAAFPRLRWLILLPLGFAWAWYVAGEHLATRLAPAMEGRDLVATGWVHSLPESHGDFISFEFRIETLDGHAPGPEVPELVRLSWSEPGLLPRPGEHWRLGMRLHRPRGYMDPGGFDYEGWLFRRGVGATGYVAGGIAARIDDGLRYPLLRARYGMRERIQAALAGDEFTGMAAALATGDQSGIDPDQWQVLSATNTVHLMAIAGLHIGVVAGFLFLLVRFLWRRSAWLCIRCPASVAAGVVALMGAIAYSAMAGFPLPTRRALIMLTAVMVGVLLRRRLRPLDTLGLAILGVLFLEPLAAGEVGFWLSFGAVAAILFAFSGRLGASRRRLAELLRTQWAVGVALLPFLAFFFHRAGLTAPIANFVVVPLYCLLVVPLTLMGAVLVWIWPPAGTMFLKGATGLMALGWPFLDRLAHLQSASFPSAAPDWPWVMVALLGAAWFLMPRGIPARALGAALMLPLFVAPASGIAPGSFDVTLLDVGEGLSAVVRTAGHVLVFDTGPGFYPGSDAGQEVLIPYLESAGIAAPDLAVVSHGDRDHAGGLASLRAAYPAMPVMTGAHDRFPDVSYCMQGQHWRWDGVEFEMLYPDQAAPGNGNDASCVLKVSSPAGSALFTGDIERRGERTLLALQAPALASDLLVAPHHGSNSSSSPPFVAAVAPKLVLFPVGYRNRWGFPKPEVLERYRKEGATLADTVQDGAICVRFRPGDTPAVVMRWRRDAARLWTER